MNEAHYLLIGLIVFLLWSFNIIRLVPKGPWDEERAKKNLSNVLNREKRKGVFK